MKPFTQHRGVTAPIMQDNVDTDQIIPSREMTRVSKTGLGDGLFAGWRYTYDGSTKVGLVEEFVLNRSDYASASIILSGRNFGCGSSREHAVWALKDFGIRAIIAESFGAIFRMNCARNGLLAIELSAEAIAHFQGYCEQAPQQQRLEIDLEKNTVTGAPHQIFEFSIDEADRHMLINGLDFIDDTLQYDADIKDFSQRYREANQWAVLSSAG
ncbi:MAG: 3-isopropylmalate dehydratase small subunit [Lysobacterales bacterium]